MGHKAQVEAFPDIKFAKSIQIAPFEDTIKGMTADLFTDFVKPHFVDQYLPLKLGQTFICQKNEDFDDDNDDDDNESLTDFSGDGGNHVDSTRKNKESKRFVEFKVTTVETIDDEDENDDDADGENNKTGRKSAVMGRDLDNYCVVGPDTEIIVDGEALDRSDDDSLLDLSYDDIGGCSNQLSKIREVLELPLRHPELFHTLGISPPRGVLMHGPPGIIDGCFNF